MDPFDFIYFLSIFLLSYIITTKFLHKFQNLPPTPFPTLPILGHLHLFKDRNSAHQTFTELSNKYGPIVSLQLGSRKALLVSSPSIAEECLHQNDVVFANRPKLVGGKILGYNFTTMLWASYGPLWCNHRRIASTEILSPQRLHLLADIRTEEVRLFIQSINTSSNNISGDCNAVDVKPALFALTNNVMMRMIAGKRIYEWEDGGKSDEGLGFRGMVRELLDLGGEANSGDFFPWLKYLGYKGPEKKFKDLFERLDRVFQGLVDQHRNQMDDDGDGDGKKIKSLIEVLLELQKSDPDPGNGYFSDYIIKGFIQILLLAGTETSATTIEWALSLLLNHPQILSNVRQEIDEIVGSNQLIKESDLDKLPYLQCIISETLRMYPIAPMLPPHESSTDCIVGGYLIPSHTMLLINVWAIQNNPMIWDEPRVFKPERFEGFIKGDYKKLELKFMPFGSGRRACPGENLALRVVGLALGSLIQCFDLERVGEELVDMETKAGVNMWKAKPLQAKCRLRKDRDKLIS